MGRFEVFCLAITASEERLVETGGPHRVVSDNLFGDVLKIGNQTPPGTLVDYSRGSCRADLRFCYHSPLSSSLVSARVWTPSVSVRSPRPSSLLVVLRPTPWMPSAFNTVAGCAASSLSSAACERPGWHRKSSAVIVCPFSPQSLDFRHAGHLLLLPLFADTKIFTRQFVGRIHGDRLLQGAAGLLDAAPRGGTIPGPIRPCMHQC